MWIKAGTRCGAAGLRLRPLLMASPRAALPWLAVLMVAGLPKAASANNCEAIQADIDARLQAKGLSGYRLFNVEVAASAPGRVVGQCDKGTRKIMHAVTSAATPAATTAQTSTPATGTAAAPPKTANTAPNDGIPTECKDGTIVIGPDCSAGRRRAASR